MKYIYTQEFNNTENVKLEFCDTNNNILVSADDELCYIEVKDGEVDLSMVVEFKKDSGWFYE